MESIGEIPQCDRTTSDGRIYPSQRKPISILNPTAREQKAIQNPAVVEKLVNGETSSPVNAHKLVMSEAKAERKSAEYDLSEDDCLLFCADIKSGLPEIPDNSVDFIITDPPYPKEYLTLYEDLSFLASRVLKDGGSLLCMCGQSYLNEVMTNLCFHMEYHWTLCYLTPGGQSPQLWAKSTNTFWKPIIWLTKGKYKGDLISDIVKTPPNENDKTHHEWGQSVAGFDELVKKFAYPGQTILDPFLGGGTTAICALKANCRFIGVDISQECIEKTKARLAETKGRESP